MLKSSDLNAVIVPLRNIHHILSTAIRVTVQLSIYEASVSGMGVEVECAYYYYHYHLGSVNLLTLSFFGNSVNEN